MPYIESEDAHGMKANPNLYARIEYPKMMYHKAGGKPMVCRSPEDQVLMEKDGWETKPIKGHVDNGFGEYVAPIPPKVEAQQARKGA